MARDHAEALEACLHRGVPLTETMGVRRIGQAGIEPCAVTARPREPGSSSMRSNAAGVAVAAAVEAGDGPAARFEGSFVGSADRAVH